MPKTTIDYSHTFIYKICCKDPTITDIYVGHTTNVVKRRQSHKCNCNTNTTEKYNRYVYQFIRNNGGWSNWTMIVLIELNCKDKNEALREERKYLEELKATLNKQKPTRTDKEYKEDHTEYYKKQRSDYYLNNKEKLDEYNRIYHLNRRLKKKQEKETIS